VWKVNGKNGNGKSKEARLEIADQLGASSI
jgi:hypothetical protein